MARLRLCLVFVGLIIASYRPSSADGGKSTNDLFAVVDAWRQKTIRVGFKCVLTPEWIGTIERKAYDDYGKAFIKDDADQRVRFDLAIVVPDWHGATNVALGVSWGGKSYSHQTIFRESLPSIETITKAEDLQHLRTILGPPDGCDGGDCWWLLFTVEPTNRVRVLSVHAGSPMYWHSNTFGVHYIADAIFRPANPNSQEEIRTFKTGRELFMELEQEKARRRAQFAPPLQTIIEAKEKPDDSNLEAYSAALNNFRNKPSRELMEQFVEWIDEGTTQVSRILGDYLSDDRSYLKLTPWQNNKRQLALRELVNFLPRARTSSALTGLLWIILEAEGGGDLIVRSDQKTLVDVGVELKTGSKSQRMTATPADEELLKAAESCRDFLKQKYPHLK
jgi:hypothetical protein